MSTRKPQNSVITKMTWVLISLIIAAVITFSVVGIIILLNKGKHKQSPIPAKGETWVISHLKSPDGKFCDKNSSKLSAVDVEVQAGQSGCTGLSLRSTDNQYDYSSNCIIPDPKDPHKFSFKTNSSAKPAAGTSEIVLGGQCKMDTDEASFTCHDSDGNPSVRGWAATNKHPSDVASCDSQVNIIEDGQTWRTASVSRSAGDGKPVFCEYPGEMRVSKADSKDCKSEFEGSYQIPVDATLPSCQECLDEQNGSIGGQFWCVEDSKCAGGEFSDDHSVCTSGPESDNCIMRSGWPYKKNGVEKKCKYIVDTKCTDAQLFKESAPTPINTTKVCIKNTPDGFNVARASSPEPDTVHHNTANSFNLGGCREYNNPSRFICDDGGQASAVGWSSTVSPPPGVAANTTIAQFHTCIGDVV